MSVDKCKTIYIGQNLENEKKRWREGANDETLQVFRQ